MKSKYSRPRLTLDTPRHVVLYDDGSDGLLVGQVIVETFRPTVMTELVLEFSGELVTQVQPMTGQARRRHIYAYSYAVVDRETHLDAGVHAWPFRIAVPSNIPLSICAPHLSSFLAYSLQAHLSTDGRRRPQCTRLLIHLVRSIAVESLAFANSVHLESEQPDRALYAVALPHKAWACGDSVSLLVKISPLSKVYRPASVQLLLREQSKSADRSFSFTVASHDAPWTEPSAGPSSQTLDDLSRVCTLDIPTWTRPSYCDEGILIKHHLVVVLSFDDVPDGVTSSITFTLPIQLLSHFVLPEVRAAALPSRRALLGGGEDDADDALPSYGAHVQDEVAYPSPPRRGSLPLPPAEHETLMTRLSHALAAVTRSKRPAPVVSEVQIGEALSRVPSYDLAVTGVVPPLYQMQDLPAYD